MSDLARNPEAEGERSPASSNSSQTVHSPTKGRASLNQQNEATFVKTILETGVHTTSSLFATVTSVYTVLVLGTLTYSRVWNHKPHRRKVHKNLLTRKPSKDLEAAAVQDETMSDTTIGDERERSGQILDNLSTDEGPMVSGREKATMVTVQPRHAEKWSIIWLKQRLRESEFDNSTLRKEIEALTTRIDKGHTGFESELKRVRDELFTVQEKNQTLEHAQFEAEQKTMEHQDGLVKELKRVEEEQRRLNESQQFAVEQTVMECQTGVEDELKRVREELVTVQQQYHDAQIHTERKNAEHREGLGNELKRMQEEHHLLNTLHRITLEEKMVASQKSLEDELKRVQEELSTVQQKNKALQHAQLQREQETSERQDGLEKALMEDIRLLNESQWKAGEVQTGLEDEMKSVKQELATFQQQDRELRGARLQAEQSTRERPEVFEKELKDRLNESQRIVKEAQTGLKDELKQVKKELATIQQQYQAMKREQLQAEEKTREHQAKFEKELTEGIHFLDESQKSEVEQRVKESQTGLEAKLRGLLASVQQRDEEHKATLRRMEERLKEFEKEQSSLKSTYNLLYGRKYTSTAGTSSKRFG